MAKILKKNLYFHPGRWRRWCHHSLGMAPYMAPIAERGKTSANAIAAGLNARKIAARRGGRWTHSQVANVLGRS